MDLEMKDVVVFVYTLGVMVSGLWIGSPVQPKLTPVVVVLLAIVAIGWTAYFNWRITPQFIESDEDEDSAAADDGDDDGEEIPDRSVKQDF